MGSESEEDYEVGYRKPPVATRFKKGKSGNPSGRPKRITAELDPGKLLETIDNEEIVVAIDGKPHRMPKAEIHFRQLFNKAIKGDLTAARTHREDGREIFWTRSEGALRGADHRCAQRRTLPLMPKKTMSTGYRNPPKDTQFRKGRSGNPKGRPRRNQRQVSVGSLFRKVARGQVPIEVDGKRMMMSRWHAYVRQIHTMALNKNASASRLLDQLRRQFPGNLPPGDPIVLRISENESNY